MSTENGENLVPHMRFDWGDRGCRRVSQPSLRVHVLDRLRQELYRSHRPETRVSL